VNILYNSNVIYPRLEIPLRSVCVWKRGAKFVSEAQTPKDALTA
jgi:hypothetical protein